MEYILGQTRYETNENDNTFMTFKFLNAEPIVVPFAAFKNNESDELYEEITFDEQCLYLKEPLVSEEAYYFHGKIKMLKSVQTIDIRLVKVDNVIEGSGEIDSSLIQYIKTVNIHQGTNSWYDIEFVFKPLASGFNGILFQCRRNSSDFQIGGMRKVAVMYEEVSLINNVVSDLISEKTKIVKLGVQSRPSMLMCINGEEVKSSKTGIYEVRNGIVTVNSFSAVGAASEVNSSMENIMLGSPKDHTAYEYSEEIENSYAYAKYTLSMDDIGTDKNIILNKLKNEVYREINVIEIRTLNDSSNPKREGYFNKEGNDYKQTRDETYNPNKKYYKITDTVFTEFSPEESISFLNTSTYPKKRTIYGFTLDYMVAREPD